MLFNSSSSSSASFKKQLISFCLSRRVILVAPVGRGDSQYLLM